MIWCSQQRCAAAVKCGVVSGIGNDGGSDDSDKGIRGCEQDGLRKIRFWKRRYRVMGKEESRERRKGSADVFLMALL